MACRWCVLIKLRHFNAYTDWDYVHTLTSAIACSDTCGVTACDGFDGRIFGVALFDQLTPNSAQCHIAITHPMKALRAGLLNAAGEYIFNDRGRNIVYGLVPASNDKALKFNENIGFKQIMRLPDGFDIGVDYVLMEMTRAACRWLKKDEGVQHG